MVIASLLQSRSKRSNETDELGQRLGRLKIRWIGRQALGWWWESIVPDRASEGNLCKHGEPTRRIHIVSDGRSPFWGG